MAAGRRSVAASSSDIRDYPFPFVVFVICQHFRNRVRYTLECIQLGHRLRPGRETLDGVSERM